MAEGEGFEPPEDFRLRRFSKPVPSTTRPSFPRQFLKPPPNLQEYRLQFELK